MDNFTKEKRSWMMAQIHSADTRPEKAVRSALHAIGFRFRKNYARLVGHPDIVFPRYHALIFVNGCFWHGHLVGRKPCEKYRIPKTNTEFWRAKIERNKNRDAAEIEQLIKEGWRVGIVWECSITGKNRAMKIRNVSESISLWLEEGFDETSKEF